MPMRGKNVKRSQASSQTNSKGSLTSQLVLSTRTLVPVAKSVPVARKKKPVEAQRKNRSYSTWKHETATSFLKPPLVSTSGQGLPRSDLQDWIRDSRLAINIDRASRCSLKDNRQKTMPAWKKLKQYREQMKIQSSENQQEQLPFPYNPQAWKIQSGTSLLSMDSLLTMPQMEITSWESSIGTPESNRLVNDRENSVKEKQSSIEEFSVSSRSSTISKSTLAKFTSNESKSTAYSVSSEIHPPSGRSTLSKLVEQRSNKSILISSPDESQSTISTESERPKVEEVVENTIWQGMAGALLPVLDENPDDRQTCRRRYSWQVVDSGLQTSRTLLDDLVKMEHERIEKEKEENARLKCNYKYSWQIIGIETQTSPKDYEESSSSFKVKTKPRDSSSWQATPRRPSDRRVKFCTNEQTQTCASKENQTNFTEIYAMSRKVTAKLCA